MLYEYAVVYEGKKNKDGDWAEKPELLSFEKVLAKSEAEVQVVAARSIDEKFVEKLDRVTILVRPF